MVIIPTNLGRDKLYAINMSMEDKFKNTIWSITDVTLIGYNCKEK